MLIQFIIHVRIMYNSQTNEFYLAHLKTPFHANVKFKSKQTSSIVVIAEEGVANEMWVSENFGRNSKSRKRF